VTQSYGSKATKTSGNMQGLIGHDCQAAQAEYLFFSVNPGLVNINQPGFLVPALIYQKNSKEM